MPIYEYHCKDCGTDFECLVLGSHTPECTGCKSKNVSKLMSACGFVTKGAAPSGMDYAPSAPSSSSSCSGCSAASCAGCH